MGGGGGWRGMSGEEDSEMEHLCFKKILRVMILEYGCHAYGCESQSKSYYYLSKIIFVECFRGFRNISYSESFRLRKNRNKRAWDLKTELRAVQRKKL